MILACDRPGCHAAFRATNVPNVAPRELLLLAESAGWQIEPAIAPLRHFCPQHHVSEQDLARPAAVGIRRAG